MNIAIIQCRFNSTRLPGKAMMEICGKTTLEHVVERVSASKKLNQVWVATGLDDCNDPIRKLCKEKGIKCYSGDNDNVLKRFCDLLLLINANTNDNIVRITADCPMNDPKIIDTMLSQISDKVYYGNQNNIIDGFDVEIIKARTLFDSLNTYGYDEHVTLEWKTINIDKVQYWYYDNIDRSKVHLSLDTQDDFDKISDIFNKLYPENKLFDYTDVLKLLGEL